MQEIPNWIVKVVETEKLECRNCKMVFSVDNLMSISVQESSKSPHKDTLCIGLYCHDCKELMIFELKEMSLIDFAFEILDQETSNKIQKKSKDDSPALANKSGKKRIKRINSKSKITRKEVDDIKKFLGDKNLSHEEFLIALGMLPEDIKKYNYKK